MEKILIVLVICSLAVSVDACCFPKQVEGFVGLSMGQLVNGTGLGITGLYKQSVDANKQKVYIDGTIYVNGKEMKEEVLDDYGNGKEYVVINGKCKVIPLMRKQLTCIPADAKLVMSSYFGFDNKKLDIDMYSFMYAGMRVTLSVMRDGCVPLSEHVEVDKTMADFGFMGLKSGVSNATVFNIPAACQRMQYVPYTLHETNFLKKRHHSSLH